VFFFFQAEDGIRDRNVTGVQTCALPILTMTLLSMGVSAVSLNAWQVPMHTTSDYQNAKLKRIRTERIRKELEDNKIVVITGFQRSEERRVGKEGRVRWWRWT